MLAADEADEAEGKGERDEQVKFSSQMLASYVLVERNHQAAMKKLEADRATQTAEQQRVIDELNQESAAQSQRIEDLSKQQTLLHLRRPFRFYFHRLEVRDTDGNLIGAIRRRWTWFRRKYTVEGPGGEEVATLFGPFWRPWTFKILMPGSDQEVGLIQKKWSGLAKELFTHTGSGTLVRRGDSVNFLIIRPAR